MIVQHGKTYKQPRRVVTCPRAGRAPCFGGGYALYTLVMGTPTQGHQRTFAAACPTPNQHLTCLKSMYDPNRRIALTRFRTSCHDLRIERERYLPRAIQAPTHERTCLFCASPAIEDESHMAVHCPIYDHLRFEYADLFPPDLPTSIPCFLSQDQNRVASFINDCHVLRRRNTCMSLAGSESAL